MTQVSKHKLNNQVYDKIFSLFPKFLSRLSKQNNEQVIIQTLFSSTERTMIAKRIAISFMLVKGYTYHSIMDKLKVSLGTVAKIAELTKNADEVYIRELQLISQEEEFFEFLSAIGYKLSIVLPPKGRNWSTWRKQIEIDRNEGNNPF